MDEERQEKLASYRKGPEALIDALQQFPRDMWRFKASDEDWSIQEMVVHILDSEINGYIRIRKAIAEPGSTITAYDGDQWAKTFRYQEQNLEEAVDLFQLLRVKTYRILNVLPEETWAQTIEHPERGTLTLDDLLTTYERHVYEYLDQMRRVYSTWVEQDW